MFFSLFNNYKVTMKIIHKRVDKISQPNYIYYMKMKKNFGNIVRELREKKGLGIKRLAPDIGVSYTYLSKIENDKTKPSEEFIEKIADYFEYEKEELLIRSGRLPKDIIDIIKENPKDAIDLLRKEFGAKKP